MKKFVKISASLLLSLLLIFNAFVTFSASDGAGTASGDVYVDKIEFSNPDFIKGMDVSSVIALEESGVKYYNENGEEEDLFKILADNGVNYIRVRVWNNPYTWEGKGYGGGNSDVEKAAEIGRRAAQYGMKLYVDFHYSDFWADPSKQTAPSDWANFSLEDKAVAVSRFTASSLQTIKDAGANIGMVQIGNETNSGMAGEYQFEDASVLFNAGANAVRDFDNSILVALHFAGLDEPDNIKWIAEKLDEKQVDYDVFAVSYYPYWHGSLDGLTQALNHIAETYGKYTLVAETSYAYTLDDSDGHPNTVSGQNNSQGENIKWEFSPQGQAQEVHDVMSAVNDVQDGKGLGVFYWEGAWITVGDTTGLYGDDYTNRVQENQRLWNEYGSGWASPNAAQYDYEAAQYCGGSAVDNQAFFDPSGKALPSLKVFKLVGGEEEETQPTSDVTEATEPSDTQPTSDVTEATETSDTQPTSDVTQPTSDVTEATETSDTQPITEATKPTEATEPQPTEYHAPVLKTSSATLKVGATAQITVLYSNNQEISYRISNANVAVVSSSGLVSALKAGSTQIVVTVGRTKLIYSVKVTGLPKITVGGKEFKKSTVYTIQKGKELAVKITGKAKAVNNVYSSSNSKVAKVTSAVSAATVKIKGLKKGTATITLKVNGYSFAIKVKVNEYKSYVLNGMEVGSLQSDGSILFKVQKTAALNGRALVLLLDGSAKRKIVLPKKTIKIDRVLWLGSNKTVIATGATIFQTDWQKNIIAHNCTKLNYGSLKNVTIQGGTWQIKDNAKARRSTSTFRFNHAQGITIKNARVDTNYISHAIELIACKNVTVSGCKLIAQGKQKNDKYAEPLQIDIATKATAPFAASYGKKYVNGQTCMNITIQNCTITGSRGICTNKTDTENGKWLKNHHSNVKIIGCTVTGMETEALCLHNVMGVTVKNTKAYSKGGDSNYNNGCYFASFGYNRQTSKYKNEFSGNTFKGGSHALYIQAPAGNKHGKTTITNNSFYAKSGASSALGVSGCTSVVQKNNKLYKW